MAEAPPVVCPQCQFKNSPQKNFCDRCGAPLVAPSSPAGDIPRTEIRSAPPPVPEAGGFQIQAGRSAQSFTPPPPTTGFPAPAAPPTTKARSAPRGPIIPGGLVYVVKSAASILFLLAVGAGAWFLWLQREEAFKPEHVGLAVGEQFLGAMSKNDYANAYPLLSRAAKATLTMDQFRQTLSTTSWTWSDPKALKPQADSVGVGYVLAASGAPPVKDLFFVLPERVESSEDQVRWTVAYNIHLRRDAAEYLSRNNPDMAYLQAEAALRISPRDPYAQGLLCRAARTRRMPEAQALCARAAELAQDFGGPK